MDNWIYDLLDLPAECQVEESLPKNFLSSNFELTSGQKNLLNYGIKEMTIVGTIGPEAGNVPSYAADEVSMESVAVLLVETKGGKFAKEASKVADMLQNLIPQFLLIGLTDGEHACLSVASKCKSLTEEGHLQVQESFITPLFAPEDMEEMSKDFSFQNIDKENLNALWNNYCKLVADIK